MDKALNYLALSRKAGLIELGEEPVGAAARLGKVGDVVTIMAFSLCSEEEAKNMSHTVIVLDEKNGIKLKKGGKN